MNIARFLDSSARSHGHRAALCLGPRTVQTYAAMGSRVQALAGALAGKFGLAQGNRVAVVMTNHTSYLEVLFATWWAGMAVVPVNARLHAKEVEYILQKSRAKLCFANGDTEAAVTSVAGNAPELREVIRVDSSAYQALTAHAPRLEPATVAATDPAWLFFTSGTTGRPKAATLTHRNLLMMSLAYLADIQPVTVAHTIFHAAPLSHGTGLLALPHIAKASPNVIMESRSMNHEEILGLLRNYTGVTMYHTPTMLKRLVEHPALADAHLANLDLVFYGGSPMYLTDLRNAIERLGQRLTQMWAQAETPNTGTALGRADHVDVEHPRYLARIASAGTVRTGVELRIVDPDDNPVPVGELGEVVVRGDVVMAGYWEDPEANARTLRGGWLHTGDVGSIDADGYLSIQDRMKDMIISGGFNIYPREIEEVLLQHTGVAEVSVIGRPHPDYVEEVVACVVRRPGAAVSESDLDQLCLDNIARFKRPRAYFFLSELPKGYYGKVEKRQLRELLAQAQPVAAG
jgi:long-chain acyl-CoA synthetase